MNYKLILLNIIFFAVILSCTTNKKIKATDSISKLEKPNIIILLADDLGFADVGYNGCKDIPTPNIDALATNGITFTNGYVTASICSPTRAGLLTGRYQQRFGFENLPGPRKKTATVKVGVPLSEKLISKRLKTIGYNTACFGKWHIGGESGDTDLFPLNRGFDEFFGFLEGAALYIDPLNSEKKYMRNNNELELEEEYYTDAITRESISFIKRNAKNPFFLYVPYNAVHTPLQATDEYLKLFDTIKNPNRRLLAAMNFAMDKSIGEIMTTLKELGLEENTLIFFLSDNGGKPKGNFSYNLPLKGEKGQKYEGGIHVPFLVQWKGHYPVNKLFKKPVSSLDIVPTIMIATGLETDVTMNLDGVNLTPYIIGEKDASPHNELYWKRGKHFAMRNDEWKIVKMDKNIELYNLQNDPNETTDLSEKHFDLVADLLAIYKKWDSKNIPAQFGNSKTEFPFEEKRIRRTELKR